MDAITGNARELPSVRMLIRLVKVSVCYISRRRGIQVRSAFLESPSGTICTPSSRDLHVRIATDCQFNEHLVVRTRTMKDHVSHEVAVWPHLPCG